MKIVEILENIAGGDWWLVECNCNMAPCAFAVSPDERKDGFVKCRYCGERFDCATIFVKWEAGK